MALSKSYARYACKKCVGGFNVQIKFSFILNCYLVQPYINPKLNGGIINFNYVTGYDVLIQITAQCRSHMVWLSGGVHTFFVALSITKVAIYVNVYGVNV